jgi:predicted pPIWI-associating nuclease
MSSYDDIVRIMREADRILAPLREFERLYGRGLRQVAEDVLERERLFRAALPELSSSYRSAIESLQPALDQLHEFERHSPAMGLLADAHSSFSGLLSRHAGLENIAQTTIALSPHWQENIAVYQRLGQDAAASELALRSHYSAVAESAFLAQEQLLRVPWESIGSATPIDPEEFSSIRERFTVLTETYRSLVQSFAEREHFMASFPPIVSGGPPLEIFTSARVLDVLSRRFPEEGYSEVDRQTESDLEDEIEATTDQLLAALNPKLRSIWLGAKEALRSGNPDRGRHVVVSLRELVTHVLHTLAPNERIKTWTSDPSYFHEGRPTREARVLFICRGVNHGPFSKFVIADVRASIEFIDLFQRGTHELAVSFSEIQLRALITRTESLLRFLLVTSRITQ